MTNTVDQSPDFGLLRAVGFKGSAKPIEDLDLPRIGAEIGVGEDELHALMEVEASGSGFDSQGRPKILFEPHVFYRNLETGKREQAVALGLAYKDWKATGYPKDSYPRFLAALEIDETAAIKACSWGLGQILGENAESLGFDSPQAMVVAFAADEDAHLEAMVKFLVVNHLDDDLRQHNWAGVARGYNGPKYATLGYHTKLANAFAKWAKIKDTPYSQAPIPVVVVGDAAPSSSGTAKAALIAALAALIVAVAGVLGVDVSALLKALTP